jgi:hypothetical protein
VIHLDDSFEYLLLQCHWCSVAVRHFTVGNDMKGRARSLPIGAEMGVWRGTLFEGATAVNKWGRKPVQEVNFGGLVVTPLRVRAEKWKRQ